MQHARPNGPCPQCTGTLHVHDETCFVREQQRRASKFSAAIDRLENPVIGVWVADEIERQFRAGGGTIHCPSRAMPSIDGFTATILPVRPPSRAGTPRERNPDQRAPDQMTL